VKKRLILFVRSVEILDQTQQTFPIKTSELCLTSVQEGCEFDCRVTIRLFDFTE
jgi:hypothetical protein